VPAERRLVALAASPGGHVDLLIALADVVAGDDRLWVLPQSSRRRALAADGERTASVRIFGSNPRRLLHNLRDVGRALRGAVPDVVVTSGAGVVVPYCLFARALGARLIYMETMARVTTGSRAGRLLSRVAETTLVQWPESLEVYPHAQLCAPPLLEAGPAAGLPAPAGERHGTFVALGTHWQRFDRLMVLVERAARDGILPGPVTAQVGDLLYESDIIETVPSVAPGRLAELIRDSEVVVCHGGAGILATAIRAGRRPLALARQGTLGEHIDDHQNEIVDKLGSLGLLAPIGDAITPTAVARARGALEIAPRFPGEPMAAALAAALGDD
jgi:UDP-N-acetylglucosamine transferase subunit ALG13